VADHHQDGENSHVQQEADLSKKSVLIVGVGGLGCPVAIALVQAGVGEVVLCDNDTVEETNLHRQVLFSESDLGDHKLDAAYRALKNYGSSQIRLERTRLLPSTARTLVQKVDLVVEGADNFATKFLAADACYLEHRPLVHGAAVRLLGTALSVAADGRPCYRCLFESVLPPEQAPNCSEAGVLGPVVGVIGALMADLALDILSGDDSRLGQIHSFDSRGLKLRTVKVHSRPLCPLCGNASSQKITDIHPSLYGVPAHCVAPLSSVQPQN
jgi:molybdopterin/thiamine biosynthesis adenylyltransferase